MIVLENISCCRIALYMGRQRGGQSQGLRLRDRDPGLWEWGLNEDVSSAWTRSHKEDTMALGLLRTPPVQEPKNYSCILPRNLRRESPRSRCLKLHIGLLSHGFIHQPHHEDPISQPYTLLPNPSNPKSFSFALAGRIVPDVHL